MFDFKLYQNFHYVLLGLFALMFFGGFFLIVKYLKNKRKKFLVSGVIVLIISSIITFVTRVGFFPGGGLYDPIYRDTQVQIQSLQENLLAIKVDCGRFPTTKEGLISLVLMPNTLDCPKYKVGGYLIAGMVPLDSYDHAFFYSSDGVTYEIFSIDAHAKLKIIGTNAKKAELDPL